MATHDIEVEIPPRLVLHKDVSFVIKSDGLKLGELRVSKGTIDWRPGNKRKVVSLTWEQFDRLMREGG
jgi:hypothetical protein